MIKRGTLCTILGLLLLLAALLLNQLDFYVSDCKCVGGFISIGEVSQRCAHDGDRDQCDAQENGCQFLFHVCFAPFM